MTKLVNVLILLLLLLTVAVLSAEEEHKYTQHPQLSPQMLRMTDLPAVSPTATVDSLKSGGYLIQHDRMCLTHANKPTHVINRIDNSLNLEQLRSDVAYLPNNTYWLNEYLHVGHVMYDLVLLQLLYMGKIDRVILQRIACYESLCHGIGTFDGFFKGYFLAALEAFAPGVNHNASSRHIPIYLRYSGRQKHVSPVYLTATIGSQKDAYFQNVALEKAGKGIELHHRMCFEEVYRRPHSARGNSHHFYGAVSLEAIKKFKAAAYQLVNKFSLQHAVAIPSSYFLPELKHHIDQLHPSLLHKRIVLTEHFQPGPIQILIAYRGPRASRFIANVDDIVAAFQHAFTPASAFVIHTLNTSDNSLTFQQQITTIATPHVVITNHGAYESNVIYMKNSSLLIEIAGNYDNSEFYTYQKLAHMFGVFFGRIHIRNMTSHDDRIGYIAKDEVQLLVSMVQSYVQEKAFRHNLVV